METTTTTPTFPMRREEPLDLPADLVALLDQPLRQVELRMDGTRVWLVTRHEEICAVLRDSRFSADFTRQGFPARMTTKPPGAGVPFTMDPPEHTRLRRALAGEFSPGRAESSRAAVQQVVDVTLDEMIAQGQPVDFVAAFARPMAMRVLCDLLGAPHSDAEFILQRTRIMDQQSIGRAARQAARDELVAYVHRLAEEKAELPAPGEDVLSRLVHGQERSGELTREEVVGFVTVMILVGFEQTANQLPLGLVVLDQHPDQRQALLDDPALVPGFVEELMRHQTVVEFGGRRVAMEDVEVGGQMVRAGDGLLVVFASGNRDPRVFPDPDRFDIARDAGEQLGFGHGIHLCVGQFISRVELQVAFATLFRRLPGLRPAQTPDEIHFRGDERFIHGIEALQVVW
ncbi:MULTISPECIES: cytochrome P450 [Micromonospora]|uniref:Cytochrome P450 n=1 Tax=Micromonospora tulbaghiae TaxID=479978 RepID=A0ABY0KHN1_9ACTN|nr:MULTISPECIES: cytochrome P450 [Micromonospora]MDX5459240.1 cytochrome P450 [Micromonospora tulbaghiae]SCE73595.1 hypothetical protein GA0070562_2129 [Micromonospora tulbaghiae]